jgi:Na+-driven multidrug efflux pump
METGYKNDVHQRNFNKNSQETTPLLTNKSVQFISYAEELGVIAKTSVPVIFAYMLQNSLQTSCVLIVGHMV